MSRGSGTTPEYEMRVSFDAKTFTGRVWLSCSWKNSLADRSAGLFIQLEEQHSDHHRIAASSAQLPIGAASVGSDSRR